MNDPDETEGRRLYRAYANAIARGLMRRVSLKQIKPSVKRKVENTKLVTRK